MPWIAFCGDWRSLTSSARAIGLLEYRPFLRCGAMVAENAVEAARREAAASAKSPYEMQANVLRRLLQSYFEIVRKKIQDSVPKAIILKLVNKVRLVPILQRSLARP